MNRNETNAAAAHETPKRRRPAIARNGVDVPTLFATLDVVAESPELAKFEFRAANRWMAGTHSRTTMLPYRGAGGEHVHAFETTFDGDHPAVLVGTDKGPTPVEFLLHAIATCLTAGIANIASARGVTLESVTSRIEGDIDLSGILGLSKDARNGYREIRVSFAIRGDAPPEKLREIVEQSRARSAVYDVLTNGVPVVIEMNAE